MTQCSNAADPATGRRYSFVRRMLLVVASLGLGGAAGAGTASPAPVLPVLPVLELREAEFSGDQGATWSHVALPDTWAQRGLRGDAFGRYRFSFDLPAPPDSPMSLLFTRLSTQHRIRLNGALVANKVDGASRASRGLPAPFLIDLPPSLQHAGTNWVELEVVYTTRAGLSPVVVGPTMALVERHNRTLLFDADLPRALNMAAAGVALFMLTLWWRRRGEIALGSFGALSLLGALRNYSYFGVGVFGPLWLTNWMFFAAQVGTVVLLGVFAQSLAGRWRTYQRWLLLLLAVMLPLAGVASGLGQIDLLRRLGYPLLALTSLPALAMLVRHAHQKRDLASAALAACIGVTILAGLHDYAFQTGLLDVTGNFWLPYVMPLALCCLAMVLVDRMVRAVGEVEALNIELDQRVAARTRELEAANATKIRFLAAASHDLRQPVVTIGLLVGMVREKVAGLPPVHAMVDRIYAAVGSMEALLNGLMDLSRLEPGTLKPRLQTVPLTRIFEAIDRHEHTAASLKGLTLSFRPTDLAVTSDPVLLDQIVRNLVGNAIRYTERGGVLVTARRRGPKVVLLQVWDTGRGIPAEAQAGVFEEFVQLDNPGRDRSKGLGLGLAIVSRGAHALGARLGLRSVPLRGSCFSIALPWADSALAPQPASAHAHAHEPLHGRTLWLIEDDAAVREALTLRLELWGAEVHALSGLIELQAQLNHVAGGTRAMPELVISDERLADGSGLACIALICKRLGRAVPAVIVTGETAPADLARLASAGLPILRKPFRPAELLAQVHGALPPAESVDERSTGSGVVR